jgi:tetratricopeptide (TPR) repeat protein
MMNSFKKNIGIIFIICLWTTGSVLVYYYDRYSTFNYFPHDYHRQLVEEFSENPTIRTGMELADWYKIKKDYKKALFYSEKSIELGVEDIPRAGALVRFWISDIYLKLNEREKAIKNLKRSLDLDEFSSIKYEWINDTELKEIFTQFQMNR